MMMNQTEWWNLFLHTGLPLADSFLAITFEAIEECFKFQQMSMLA